MDSLLMVLPDYRRAGVYQAQIEPSEIVAAAKTAGLLVFQVNLGKASGKASLLDALAQAFKFPTHFGRNWDALNDILSDLSWVGGSGFVLLFLNADAFAADNPAVFKAAVEVLQTVAKSWREKRKPFWVLLEGSAEWKAHLPKLMLG